MILILVRFLFTPLLRTPVCFTRSVDFQRIPPLLGAAAMSEVVPTALILGHSFVKRLKRDLHQGFDSRASCDFNLLGTASVRLHGVGGRTVQTLQANDLHVVRDLAPDIVILEIGTNDLLKLPPEKVSSAIEDLVCVFLSDFSVRAIGVCYVIPRSIFSPHAMSFWRNATVLNQSVNVVLADLTQCFLLASSRVQQSP